MDITEASIIHHVGIVLFLLWLLSYFDRCHPVAYVISLIYLYSIHERYVMRLKRKLQFQERKQANQKRALSDSESVRWLNHAVEKIWPICMEQIVSQKILLPIVPWFLDKYKPWTAKKAMVQHMYLGRSPPMFTDMRVLRQFSGDDHLVLELGMSFCTADDMSAILAVKLRRRLGFGMWTKLHMTSMHVEGKVLVGVKFLRHWPFLGRLRVCFAEPPYFQMNVKPIFNHGVDVTELPWIAGWLDKLLSVAFEETLVQPNMLVVNVEKFASAEPGQPEDWFSVDEKAPIAYVNVEVVEASEMKPSDLNGLADPYVKGQLGPYKFRTKIQKKTLAPKWFEQFRIPICSWESPNVLVIEVRDKDHFVDDTLGDCTVNINDFKDGERHDLWLPLQNIKMGRLHLAITVEGPKKATLNSLEVETLNKEGAQNIFGSDDPTRGSFSSSSTPSDKSPRAADNFEPINIEGQQETGIWVHHPGNEVSQTWEPRKGKTTAPSLDSFGSTVSIASASGPLNSDGSVDENPEGKTPSGRIHRSFHKLSSVFHRGPKNEDNAGNNSESVQSPTVNIRAVKQHEIGVNFIMEDGVVKNVKQVSSGPDGVVPETGGKGHMKDMAKSILKHAEKSARSLKHAMSRKGSRKSRGDPPVGAELDISEDSDSSDDEPQKSSQVQSIPVLTSPASTPIGNGDSGNANHPELAKDRDTPRKNNVPDELSKPQVSEETIDAEVK